MLQAIAAENNLSETAFLVRNGDGFDLRWFTPKTEVALCGHATLECLRSFRAQNGRRRLFVFRLARVAVSL